MSRRLVDKTSDYRVTRETGSDRFSRRTLAAQSALANHSKRHVARFPRKPVDEGGGGRLRIKGGT